MELRDPPPTSSSSTAAPFVTEVRVRYAETDAAGVVYYGAYLAYFEVARVEWLRALDCPIREAEARGVLLPAVEARVRYLQPAHLDDLLAIHVWATDVKRVSFAFEYEVRRGQDLVARGYTRHAVVDRESLRPLPLPEWMRDPARHGRPGDPGDGRDDDPADGCDGRRSRLARGPGPALPRHAGRPRRRGAPLLSSSQPRDGCLVLQLRPSDLLRVHDPRGGRLSLPGVHR